MSSLKNYLFTSESVSEGHPDKVSDRISDMVVDSYLAGEVRGQKLKRKILFKKLESVLKKLDMIRRVLLGEKEQK